MYLPTVSTTSTHLHMKGTPEPTQSCSIQPAQSKRLYKENVPRQRVNKKKSFYYLLCRESSMGTEAGKRFIEGSLHQAPFRVISLIQYKLHKTEVMVDLKRGVASSSSSGKLKPCELPLTPVTNGAQRREAELS